MNLIGMKYQIFNTGGDMEVYRVVEELDEEHVNVIRLLPEDNTKEKIKKEKQYILGSTISISPDAMMDIMLTEKEYQQDILNDVYVCVYKTTDILSNMVEPALILRQDTYSYTKNGIFGGDDSNKVYVGDCITKDNIPFLEGDIMSICEFDKVLYNYTINLYINDKLSDILDCIPKKVHKRFDRILKPMSYRNSDVISGYSSNLKDLLIDNKFIDNYRSVYNIIAIDFPIVIDDRSWNEDGDVILNDKQKRRIEDLLRKYITNIKVIKYDHDLDIKDIVSFKHILVSDDTETIYLIAYEETGDYPTDPDIINSLGALVN